MKNDIADVQNNKIRDWIKKYQVSYNDPAVIKRELEDGEEYYKIILNPDLEEWEYGNIEIKFRLKYKYESFSMLKDLGFIRGFEPKVALGLDIPTGKVRMWIKKHNVSYVDPDWIRRKKNDSGGQFYTLIIVPNSDEWEFGDIQIIFHYADQKIAHLQSNILISR